MPRKRSKKKFKDPQIFYPNSMIEFAACLAQVLSYHPRDGLTPLYVVGPCFDGAVAFSTKPIETEPVDVKKSKAKRARRK